MTLTEEMILYAMSKLLTAGDNFGHDCPEEILWELQELQEKLVGVRMGHSFADEDVWEESDMDEQIKELTKLYN